MKKKDCNNKNECGYHLKRGRYFHGMLLSDQDFQDEQSYHLAKRRLLNKSLHGWGVVCGLELAVKENKFLKLCPGLALDCRGNEIAVCNDLTIDVEACLFAGKNGDAKSREECRDTPEERKVVERWVGICYSERKTDPEAVYVPAGGCDDKVCQPTRVQEGFCLRILESCPDDQLRAHRLKTDSQAEGLLKQFRACEEKYPGEEGKKERKECQKKVISEFCQMSSFPCPDCGCEEHYVGLGKILITLENHCVKSIEVDMQSCRCYVFGPARWRGLMHLIFDGAGENAPDPCNPMEVLCWLIERCQSKQPPNSGKDDRNSLQTLEAKHEELRGDYDELKDKYEQREDRIRTYASQIKKATNLANLKRLLGEMLEEPSAAKK